MTTDNFNPPNSVWPNGLKRDEEGYMTFYPLGTNKVDISTITWPEGDKLISPFVYQNNKLVGFVDTKALTVTSSATTTMNYNHIEADFSSISEGELTVNAPNAIVKKFTWAISTGSDETFDFVIIDFNTTNEETINTVRTAKRVVDNKLYDADDGLIGTIDTSKIEVGGIFDQKAWLKDGLFYNHDYDIILSEFNSSLSSLRDGSYMFYCCSDITSFSSDLSNLTDGRNMFYGCVDLTSFSSNLSNLTGGYAMFELCNYLTSFNSDLSSLMYGAYMFSHCKLDTASVQNIADTINTYNGLIHISIGNSSPNEQEAAAFNKMVSKGWTVYVNGVISSNIWNPTSLTPADSEEQQTSIPFYAKPVQSDEEHAHYVDEQGNFYNILGGQFIYGDDISTYGMFTCEEEAAANMRLTPYVKPQTEIENQ